jgi:hypothetical protein
VRAAREESYVRKLRKVVNIRARAKLLKCHPEAGAARRGISHKLKRYPSDCLGDSTAAVRSFAVCAAQDDSAKTRVLAFVFIVTSTKARGPAPKGALYSSDFSPSSVVPDS